MTDKVTKKYSPEVRERAVRMVLEHQGKHASQWAAKPGAVQTAATLREGEARA